MRSLVIRTLGSMALVIAGGGCLASPHAARPDPVISSERHGPLPVRVQNPFLLVFPEMPPERGVLIAPGAGEITLDASYSSLFQSDGNALSEAWLDGELLWSRLALRVGLAAGLEGRLGLPMVYGTGGFLDRFVTGYHDALGLPQGGRDQVRDDQFAMTIEHQGQVAFEMEEERPSLGDLPVGLAVQLCEEGESCPAVALRGLLELPTGDERRGFGSGHLDAGLGVAAEKGLAGWILYGNLGITANRTPSRLRRAGADAGPAVTAMIGGELPLGGGVSGVGQVGYQSSPLRGIDLAATSDDAVSLTLGGHLALGPSTTLRGGFTEDLSGDTAADISVHIGLLWSF